MPSDTGHEKLLTPAQVASIFSVDTKTVCRWAKAGKLTSVRTLGGHRRYRQAEVNALLEGTPESAPNPLRAPIHSLWSAADLAGSARVLIARLRNAAISTVGDLVVCGAGDLAELGLSPAQVDLVRSALARRGLTLHGEVLSDVA